MQFALTMLLFATTFAVAFGFGGFLFGGLARMMAHWSQRSPEKTMRRAFVAGGIQGAAFSALIGLAIGLIAGYSLKLDVASARLLVAFFLLVGFMVVLAMLLGAIGYLAQWRRQANEIAANSTPPDAIRAGVPPRKVR